MIRYANTKDPLISRLTQADEPIALPVVAVEEQLRAWLAQVHRVRRQAPRCESTTAGTVPIVASSKRARQSTVRLQEWREQVAHPVKRERSPPSGRVLHWATQHYLFSYYRRGKSRSGSRIRSKAIRRKPAE